MKKVFKIEHLLLILLILTIASIWFGLWTWAVLSENANVHINWSSKYLWGMWLWLPIPILSITFGIKYKKTGIKCTNNIVCGFVIGMFLLLFGSLSFISNSEVDYSRIYTYRQIIGLDIPSKGIFTQQKWDESHLIEHTTNIVKFTDAEEVEKFEKNIKNSNDWILKDEINSNLSIFIPLTMSYNSNSICYFSIYIEGIDQYNTIPIETGEYHIYAMVYDFKISTLTIEEYIFEFRN